MMPEILEGEGSLTVFVLVTVIMGGWAGWMAARGIALAWRPGWQCLPALLAVAAAVRFIHFALFQGSLLAPWPYAVDVAIVGLIGAAGFRYTRAGQMTTQYRWLHVRTGPLTWRPRPGAEAAARDLLASMPGRRGRNA